MEDRSSKLQNLQSEQTEFKREISLFGGINILAGIMIGSGIFYLGSYVLQYSHMSQGLALITWVVGGLVTLLCGLCFAELGAMMPKAGGNYVYLREAYGSRVAFMNGFSGFIIGNSGSIAAIAVAFIKIFRTFIEINDFQGKLIAIGMVVLLTFINYRGVKFGSWIQNFFNMAKLIPIGIILVGGLFLGKEQPNLNPIPQGASISQVVGMVALGVVATLWAYEGWTNLNAVSEEIKNPKRNIPLAIIISIVSVTVIYFLFNYSIYKVVPMERIVQMFAEGDDYLGTESAKILFGSTGNIIVTAGMLIAMFGALNGCIMVFPRYYYSMALDGMFFKSFGELHPKYKTPSKAIIASMIVSIAMIFAFGLGELTNLVTLGGLIFNALTLLSVIIFRKKYPTMERPYKVWFYPVSVIITVAVMVGLIIYTIVDNPILTLTNFIVPGIGFLIHLFMEKGMKKDQDLVTK